MTWFSLKSCMPFIWIIRGLLPDHTRGIGTLLPAPINWFVRWVKRVGLWAVADGAPHGFELNFVSPTEKWCLPALWVEQTLLVRDEEVIKRYSQFCWAFSILDQVYSLKQKRKTLVKKLTKSLARQRAHCMYSTMTKHRLLSPFEAGAQWFQFYPKFCNLIQILQPWANQKLTWQSWIPLSRSKFSYVWKQKKAIIQCDIIYGFEAMFNFELMFWPWMLAFRPLHCFSQWYSNNHTLPEKVEWPLSRPVTVEWSIELYLEKYYRMPYIKPFFKWE